MVVTTAGLLGFAGLQTRALSATEDAYLRTTAMGLAQDMLERMRINGVSIDQQSFATSAPGYSAYSSETAWGGAPPLPVLKCVNASANCTPAQMAAADVEQLRLRAASMLPSGNMLMRGACSTSQACVYVAWGDTTASDCADEYGATGTLPRQCVVAQGM